MCLYFRTYAVSLDYNKKIWRFNNFPSLLYLGLEWNIGFVLLGFIGIQVITGILLSFFLVLGFNTCLVSKSVLLRELEGGWCISYFHMVIPNFLFIFLFSHIFKSFLNNIYNYKELWVSGFFILLFMLCASFTGYGLVLGSLGFWAIVVVMSLIEFLFGSTISCLFFSDFGCLSELMILKIFGYHFLVSLSLILLIFIHVYVLHKSGSSIGVFSGFLDYFNFSSFMLIKDFVSFCLIFLFFITCLCFSCEWFFSVDNFIELDVFKVPDNINAEWYLRLIFILLRSVDEKSLGIFFIFLILITIFFKLFFRGMFGENLFSRIILYSFICLVGLLLVFTSSSIGGSLWTTSILLLWLNVIYDYSIIEVFFIYFYFYLSF